MTNAADTPATAPWPIEVVYSRSARVLTVRFDDGFTAMLPATLLRVESPSAEVQGHGEGKKIVTGKENVVINAIDPVGHYAIRIVFDDGHRTGLYTWAYLHALAQKA